MRPASHEAPGDPLQQQLNALHRFIATHDDIERLLQNAASWADSQAEQQEASRRLAWRVALGTGMTALLALVIALVAVATAFQPAPAPQILRVDKTTGATEHLISLQAFQQSPEEATIRRNIATFMRARENYSVDTAEDNYYDAAAFMSPQLQQQWGAYWDSANPKSPLNYYKNEGKVRIALGAITLNRNANGVPISVRASFTRTIRHHDQPVGPQTAWIATIPFRWVNAPTKERDRRVNDLGMEITDYQVDADIGAGNVGQQTPASPLPTPAPSQASSARQALAAPPPPAAPATVRTQEDGR